jgi:hypothetical protein
MTPQRGDFIFVRRDDGRHHKGRVTSIQHGLVVYRMNGRKHFAPFERCEVTHRPGSAAA